MAFSKKIEELSECTYCLKNKYFSYRREKPQQLKTMMVVIGAKKRIGTLAKQ